MVLLRRAASMAARLSSMIRNHELSANTPSGEKWNADSITFAIHFSPYTTHPPYWSRIVPRKV